MTTNKDITTTTDDATTPTSTGKTLVTVKFRSAGKQYDFDADDLKLAMHDEVVVETNKGRALGTVAKEPRYVEQENIPSDLKPVLRIATEADINMARISATKEHEAHDYCIERIKQRKITMKLVKAEYLFDGSKIIFYFTADGRVDFRDLVKDLAQYFHTRIEMRQIGVRDEAKLLGGIGICGRELCCGTFLTDFNPVSVRMAKQQGLALNPVKISGQCGRLLCCLGYEYETYCKMAKQLPKHGSKVTLNGKMAEVLSTQTLAQTVTVRCEGKVTSGVALEELSKNRQAASLTTPKPQPEQKITPEQKNSAAAAETGKAEAKNPKRSSGRSARSNRGRKSNDQHHQNNPASKNIPTSSGEKTAAEPTLAKQTPGNRTPRPKKEINRGDGSTSIQRPKQTPRKNRPAQPRANKPATPNPNLGNPAQYNKTSNRVSDQVKGAHDNKTLVPQDKTTITEQKNETKPSKRRNRNRRRPPQKP
jgi:cell fate regulator YaaT (PSP1 superfamily)